MPETVVVFDLGSTNLKASVVDRQGRILETVKVGNRHVPGPPYLHINTDLIWRWLSDTLAPLVAKWNVAALVPCAHGSALALLRPSRGQDGLAMPMMFYEAEPPDDIRAGYARIEPRFSEVLAPTNPGALTLGRQLFWQRALDPDAFAAVETILPAPQYWAWRLTGNAVSEATSLGAQTHIWAPLARDYSSLTDRLAIREKFAPLAKAWDVVGGVSAGAAAETGLPEGLPVLAGIHDSNANYFRYLAAGIEDFTLLSTGTWLINFNPAFPPDRLRPELDTNTNTDVFGNPVSCSRFMGGREFDIVQGSIAGTVSSMDILRLLEWGTMALPSFTDLGGPCPGTGMKGRIEGRPPASPSDRTALAALYCALMADLAIGHIGSANDVVIDGVFAENAFFCRLLAGLRPDQTVRVSAEREGTTVGAALLWDWQDRPKPVPIELHRVEPLIPDGLENYAAAWRAAALADGPKKKAARSG